MIRLWRWFCGTTYPCIFAKSMTAKDVWSPTTIYIKVLFLTGAYSGAHPTKPSYGLFSLVCPSYIIGHEWTHLIHLSMHLNINQLHCGNRTSTPRVLVRLPQCNWWILKWTMGNPIIMFVMAPEQTVYCVRLYISRVSCQKGPTRHAYAWQTGPFWQDTLDMTNFCCIYYLIK